MYREKLKSIFDALRHDPAHHLGLGDIRLTIAQQDEILAMVSPLPPAEGAEEILRKNCNTCYSRSTGEEEVWSSVSSVLIAMHEFTTLHAQRIAEKMVEERLRKELIAYDKWLYYKWVEGDVTTTEEHINEYLKSREK